MPAPNPPNDPAVARLRALTSVVREISAAPTPREVRATLADVPFYLVRELARGFTSREQFDEARWRLAARYARAFDSAMIDNLVRLRSCRIPLARNPGLQGRHLQRFVLWAWNEAARDDSTLPDSPHGVLLELAQAGQLGRFPYLVRQLPQRWRIAVNVRSAELAQHCMVPRILLGCPTVPPEVLVAFDRRIIALRCPGYFIRKAIVRHPSADATVWCHVLSNEPPAEAVLAVASNGIAIANPDVRALLTGCA